MVPHSQGPWDRLKILVSAGSILSSLRLFCAHNILNEPEMSTTMLHHRARWNLTSQ